MTDRTSCIQHPPDTPMVIIRLDYLALCSGYKHAKCAAALLNMFERWHSYKLHQRTEIKMRRKPSRKRKQANGLWVYMSQSDIHRELFEVFGLNMIGDALRELVKRGYVQERQNPNLKRDRTKQYLFLVDAVQRAVDDFKVRWSAARKAVESCENGVRPFFKFKECKLYSQRLETLVLKFRCFKTKEALPLNTTLVPTLKSTERETAQIAEPAPAPQIPLSPSKDKEPELHIDRDATTTPMYVVREMANDLPPRQQFNDTAALVAQSADAQIILSAYRAGFPDDKTRPSASSVKGYTKQAVAMVKDGVPPIAVTAAVKRLIAAGEQKINIWKVCDEIEAEKVRNYQLVNGISKVSASSAAPAPKPIGDAYRRIVPGKYHPDGSAMYEDELGAAS